LSGKSTLAGVAQRILSDSKVISTGDIARNLSNGSPELVEHTAKLDLFPSEDLMRATIAKEIEVATEFNIILEGCPRFGDQVRWIRDTYWHYFPKIIMTSVGDMITLLNRAKTRGRDERDSDPYKFADRLEKAMVNMNNVSLVAQECMIPVFNAFTTGDDVAMARRIIQIRNA
jgi:adenylate kinase family enzyme